ncbi:MAG: NAD(+) synthase [Cardiobacteriaceae bacterium]|nr:NAD(+) synthase [Cardiobacteriaceae bacterium]
MNIQTYADYLVDWLETERRDFYQMDGYVLGVSGGVDSAVAAHLLARTGAPVYGLILPSAISGDTGDAHAVLKSAGIPGEEISIAPLYDTLAASVAHAVASSADPNILSGNIQARLRMICLYTVAQSRRALVVGTDNAAEWLMGYFTKFGDGAADVVPLIHLRKEEIYALGQALGVAENILRKAPSAELWQGQTDESEMGVRYADIDAHLRGEPISREARERINHWHGRSHHKREMPRRPPRRPQ